MIIGPLMEVFYIMIVDCRYDVKLCCTAIPTFISEIQVRRVIYTGFNEC